MRHQSSRCPEVFETLEEGDLLFIDSSHSVKTGSDVVRLYTEVIPRLKPGVLIHCHDIFLPYQYDRVALQKFFGWQESVLVQALLVGNSGLEVLAAMSALHYACPEGLRRVFPDYVPQQNDEGLQTSLSPAGHFPSSLWLRVTGH